MKHLKHIKLFESFTNEGFLVDLANGIEKAGKFALDVLTYDEEYENFKKFILDFTTDIKSKSGQWTALEASDMEVKQGDAIDGYFLENQDKSERQLFFAQEEGSYLITYDDPADGMIASVIIKKEAEANAAWNLLTKAFK